MSKKQPIEIEFETKKVRPEFVYESIVVSSGNGAIIKSYKRFIGKKATIIIGDDKMERERKINKKQKVKEAMMDATELSYDLHKGEK